MRYRLMSSVAVVLLVALAIAASASACSGAQRVRTETALAEALVSDEQSQQIGKQVHDELDKQGVRYVRDAAVTGYVGDIAARLFALAKKDRGGVDYHAHVIDEPNQVNAFATPGGHLYLYSGLLLEADNEAEVAGVLGHEAGHVMGRHVERAMVNAYGLQALLAMAVGKNPSLGEQLAASIVGTGVMRAHSRSEEIEADEYGARYLSRLNYDPRAMITFFEKLAAKEGKSSRGLAWLRTHPVAQERIENLRRYIRHNQLGGSVLGQDKHRQTRQRLGGSGS